MLVNDILNLFLVEQILYDRMQDKTKFSLLFILPRVLFYQNRK